MAKPKQQLPKLSSAAQERLQSLYANFFAFMEKNPKEAWTDWPIGETYMQSGGPKHAIEQYAKAHGMKTLEAFVERAHRASYLSPADYNWLSTEVKGF